MEKYQSQTDRLSLIAVNMPRSSQVAIVGIVAILHLWVFAGLAFVKPAVPEPTPMTVSFVSHSADTAVAGQSEAAVESNAAAEVPVAQPAEEPTPADEAVAPSLDQSAVPAIDQPQARPAQSAPDASVQASPSTSTLSALESDDQLINLDVLAAVNSTLQKQSSAQQQVDRALQNLSASNPKKSPKPDRSVLIGADDAAAELAPEAPSAQSANKNSNPFPGISTACPAFFHQLPLNEQYELAGNGCTSGQVQGCELEFDQIGIKNFPAFDAQAGISQGEAVLSFTVGEGGVPTEIELLAATTHSMARSALKFLTTSRFVPLKDSSRCGPYALPVRFSLYD